VRGSTWSPNRKARAATRVAASSMGVTICTKETPLARIAVTSLSSAMRLNAYRTETRTAMESVIAIRYGSVSTKNSAITVQGSPLPSSDSIRRAT